MGVRLEVQSLWTQGEPTTFVYEFDQARVVIGRSRSADVQLPHAAVSGTHASIRTEGSGYVLVDEGSTNGTRVNEALCVPGRPKPLASHDAIDVGGYRLAIQVGVPVARSTSAKLTTSHAHDMLAEQEGEPLEQTIDERLAAVQQSGDISVPLLPIPQEVPEVSPRVSTTPPSAPPPPPRRRMGTSELVVYSMAGLLIAASVVIMVFLNR